ncbi:hypothetical protein [Telmatospirillum sp. J64-1]|uniref:hypothetical protein n=1 Tax=Telmatospirillum sp. J64-1 TaxID=2502183 RepID=UPI00163D4B00|nr:hypothetical protein [Telmatospirillum sp. J64-1]
MQSTLSTAIALWRAGKPIPLTIFAALAEQGYDVPALERFYRRQTVPQKEPSHV